MTGPAADAPLISVVLPVHAVAEYLPACLDSVLDAPDGGAGIEVVAVDDASPDGCGAILDDRAAVDPRLRVVHRAANAGPGAARNLGLAQSRGKYVWFIDPDDLVAEGALAEIAATLSRERPDVLMLDYLILHATGRAEPSPSADLLRPEPAAAAGGPGAAAGGAALTLADRPALINRTMTVWSKVFRREFLAGLGVSFPTGIHEDVPVSCAALLAAGRITLLDRVCYLYRRRERSFLATTSMDHFAIFDSYAPVLARLAHAAGEDEAAAETPARVRVAVFGRAMEHYTTVLASGLVPAGARRDFFRRMARDFARYRPPGYRPPAGPRGLKMRLLERDAYLAYEALAPLNEARVAVRRALRRLPPGADERVFPPDHGEIT